MYLISNPIFKSDTINYINLIPTVKKTSSTESINKNSIYIKNGGENHMWEYSCGPSTDYWTICHYRTVNMDAVTPGEK